MEDSNDNQQNQRQARGRSQRGGFIDPFMSAFDDPFGDFMGFGQHFSRQMRAFDDAFQKMDAFMSTDHANVPKGEGQYFCQSIQTTVLPDGVVETKRQTRTNDREQKEHYRQLGDRRVVQKTEKDLISGREDIRRDLYNVKEDDIDQFDRDFRDHRGRFDEQWGDRYLGGSHFDQSRQANQFKPLTGKAQKAREGRQVND